jgi:uncharacterized protein (TIGR02453 family)
MNKFEGFSQATIDYLWNLRFNNNREWFEAHKDEFIREFQNPMKALAREVFDRITADGNKRGLVYKVSRIYKDARRIKGGDPYRTNLWFSIERQPNPDVEWTGTPVFWFELSHENWHYGLGYYSARAETMAKLRKRIERNTTAFEKLIAPLEKQSEFILEGPEYVRKKTAPSEKTEPWFNKKTFSLIHEQAHSKDLFAPELADRLTAGYTFLMPFYDYLSTLDSDA